ncbi:MAG: response regulator [Sterolibacterium sp.]|nr:response regulator [Sterolibacterium sp.]
MNTEFLVYVVDDNNVMQTLFPAMLKEICEVEVFATAEDCLTRLAERTPDMFLLDVGLPGMDGYELCRRIRASETTRDIPITFVSAHDEENDLLTGYEAGGDDYVVKPVNRGELLHKVRIAQRLRLEKRRLFEQASDSEMLASLVMSNMDEYAVVVQFIRRTTDATQADAVAEAALLCLQGLHLKGVVQVRLGEHILTLGSEGRDRPLEIAVMQNVTAMGRLFEFKNRAVFNFPTISLMVNEMPVHEPELCGRIRDHLAIATEVAQARLEAFLATAENRRKQEGLQAGLHHIAKITELLDQQEQQARIDAATIIFHLQEDLANAFVSLGLSETQENHLDQIVQSRIDQLNQLYRGGESTQTLLAELGADLKRLVG